MPDLKLVVAVTSKPDVLVKAMNKARKIATKLSRIEYCLRYKVCPNCAKEELKVVHEYELDEQCITTYTCSSCGWAYKKKE